MNWKPTHVMYDGGNVIAVMQVKKNYFFTKPDIDNKRHSSYVLTGKNNLYRVYDEDFKVKVKHWELRDLDYNKENKTCVV